MRVAEPLPCGVQERQVGRRPRLGVLTLKLLHVVEAEPGSAHLQIGGNGPEVSHEVGCLDQRPRALDRLDQVLVLPQRLAQRLVRDLLVVVLVDQDLDQLIEDVVAHLVVGRSRTRRRERLGPVLRAQPDIGPGRLHLHAFRRRLLVQSDGRLDRAHHLDRRLQASHLGVGIRRRICPFRDEVTQGARLHALLPEAGQDVGHVGQVRLVRTDEQHPAPAVTESRVGVEEVGRAVQGDDGLAGARAAVDDECTARPGSDDRVLVGLDGAEDVAHPWRPAAAQAGDEGGLVVERCVSFESVRREHLVPVVADPPARPAEPASADQSHRVAVGGAEVRLCGRRAPVDQQPTTRAVGEAESSDVNRLGVVRDDDASEAQVETEATQGAQARGEPVDLQVPVHRLLTDAAGRRALGLQSRREGGDRLFEACRDGREVLLVAGDLLRVGLRGELVREVECAGRRGGDVVGAGLHGAALGSVLLAQVGHSEAPPGACRKPQGAL